MDATDAAGNVVNTVQMPLVTIGSRHPGSSLLLDLEAVEAELLLAETRPETGARVEAEEIIGDLEWLGLVWEEGPVRQSERQERYREAADDIARCLRAGRNVVTMPVARSSTWT